MKGGRVLGAVEQVNAESGTLEAAFRDHLPRLVRRLALVVRDVDEAEDLAQVTFLRAAERWPFPPNQDVARCSRSSGCGWRSTSIVVGSVGAS